MTTNNNISAYSHIESTVVLGKNNIISDNVIIRGNVTIGDNNYIGAGTIIEYVPMQNHKGHIVIGNDNHFASNIVIGGIPRKKLKPMKWELPKSLNTGKILIGSSNVIFENVTIHQPIDGETIIENDISIGAHTHVSHDTIIRSKSILSVNITLGGYVIIGYAASIGMGVNIHQRCVIGAYSMCGMGAAVKGHVLPLLTVAGVPAKMLGLNKIGLIRNGFSESEIINLEENLLKGIDNKTIAYGCNERLNFNYRQFLEDCDKWKREEFPIKLIIKNIEL